MCEQHQENYIHGGDTCTHPAELDFSICVNPLGMPEAAKKAALDAVLKADRYPDPACRKLKAGLARFYHLPETYLMPGNGAAELIFALCQALRPEEVYAPVPGFSEYRRAASAVGARFHEIRREMEEDFALPPDLCRTLETDAPSDSKTAGRRLLFLTNPDHPVGRCTSREYLLQIARTCEEQGIWFCLDECFLPFLAEEEKISLLRETENEYPHLIILRAFTKIYGMAGLRLGCLIASDSALLCRIREVLQPWNVSLPAQEAGAAALQDREYLQRTRQLIKEEREYLRREIRALVEKKTADSSTGKVFPGEANYIFFRAREDLKERLLEKEILIRSFEREPYPGRGYFRVGVRTHEENAALIRRWKEI